MINKVTIELKLKTKEAMEEVVKAARLAMRDTVVSVMQDSVASSPVKTGNNMRSIKMEVSGFDTGEGIVDQSKIEGAVYSTSGYGGYLETGTVKMKARPYMKPAADKHVPQFMDKMRSYLP